MKFIDDFINRTTVYRFVLLSLWLLVVVSFIEAILGWLPYTPIAIIFSVCILIFTAGITDRLCSLLTKSVPSPESAAITALIVFFILSPLTSVDGVWLLGMAAILAILSKFIFSYKNKSIFNAAAFSACISSVISGSLVSWWVATPTMLLFVGALGLFVVYKSRQYKVFGLFIGTVTVLASSYLLVSGTHVGEMLPGIIVLLSKSPLLFVGAFMLTDPQTMPAASKQRHVFAIIVGCLFSLSFAGVLAKSIPELALVAGNIYAFFFGQGKRIALSFQSSTKLSREICEYAFVPSAAFVFSPGQYVELRLLHASADKRGTRRYFSIASNPSDYLIRFTIHMPIEISTFKHALRAGKQKAVLTATGPYGDFVLPRNPNQKIAAIADGVGIAPFMSIFRHLHAQHERRDMVLIYSAATPLDFAYKDEIDAYKDSIGLKVIYLPVSFGELFDWKGLSGVITCMLIEKEIPDSKKRIWYIAGPESAIQRDIRLVRAIGVKASSIKAEPFLVL